MLQCSFSLAAAQLLVKMASALQKSECCSATSAPQHSENSSATSVFACGMLQGWGLEGWSLGLTENCGSQFSGYSRESRQRYENRGFSRAPDLSCLLLQLLLAAGSVTVGSASFRDMFTCCFPHLPVVNKFLRFVGIRKRGLLEKGSFQKCPLSRDSREFRDSRDSKELPDCGK